MGVVKQLVIAVVMLTLAGSAGAADTIFWTTGRALMPGWGLYPNGETYGGTRSLDQYSAWRAGRLTWVAEFPEDGDYTIFIRRYAGYGHVNVTIDEGPLVCGGRGWTIVDNQSNDRYRWEQLGRVRVTKGSHHVDLDIEGMFDAIVFTTNAAFDPGKDSLPEPVKNPLLRAPRRYRDDSHLRSAAGRRGFVVSSVSSYEEMLNDAVPTTNQLLQTLRVWGAANQYVNGTFTVRALRATEPLTVTVSQLVGSDHIRIGAAEIDLRVVHLRRRTLSIIETVARGVLLPDLLLRDDRTGIPPKGKQGGYGGGRCVTAIPVHESRQFWLTVHVPQGSPSGIYRGTIRLWCTLFRNMSLPVEVEVLPIELKPVEGYYTIYHCSHPIPPEVRKLDGNVVSAQRYAAELKDQVRHGCNAAILYGDGRTLHYAKEAGTTQPPVLMPWPSSDDRGPHDMATAKAMGFPDLYHYGVDEPAGERIAVCRREAEWRTKNGYHMFAAINSREGWEAVKDVVDRPVLSMNVFSGPDNTDVLYARGRGFVPVSYWMGSTHYPLWYRALAGLYNARCGYLGAAPWAYQDFTDHRIWDENDWLHAVAYPDEFGQPIPSLAWEGFRAGVDDVRYLQALDRAIAKVERRLKEPSPGAGLADALANARRVRATRFESITGRLHEYIPALKPDVLDASRREVAEATMVLERNTR
jgi:hypothetical protein